jgi:hypothetical protein
MQISYAERVEDTQADKDLMAQIAKCDPAVRAYALEEGYKNLKGRMESQAAAASQASTTLALLLAGIGGTMGYAVRVIEPAAPASARGAAVLCAYFTILAGVIVWKCLNLKASPVLHNEPENLIIPGATVEQVQAGEILNLQRRIDDQKRLLASRAKWLNAVRLAALASPLLFAAGAFA